MKSFYGVRGVNEFTDQRVVLEVGTELRPVVTPRGDNNGILLAPLLLKHIKLVFSGFFADSPINQLQVSQERPRVLEGHILQAVANLVNDAALDLGLGERRLYGLGESLQIVNAGD